MHRPHRLPVRARALAMMIAATGTVGCLAYPAGPSPTESDMSKSSLYEAYVADGRYFTPWRPFDVSPLRLARWWLSSNPYEKPSSVDIPRVANDGSEFRTVQQSAKLTWVGHSTFAIHDAGDVVLTDPHFGPRALIPGRWVEPGVPISSIPDDAMAVVSHNHYDHLDGWTIDRLPDTVNYFVPLGLAEWFRDRGREHVTELGWWQSAEHGRWKITCLPSQHWSRRLGQPTNSTLWCSWLLETSEHRYYFAGDTGYFHGFAEFGERFGPIDVAMLPIGAYEPRWFMHYQHMDPREALQAFEDLGARYMLPMHWGTFDLTDEPVDEAPREFARALEERGADPERSPLLAIGQGWHLPAAE